jgi:hypothetical protein
LFWLGEHWLTGIPSHGKEEIGVREVVDVLGEGITVTLRDGLSGPGGQVGRKWLLLGIAVTTAFTETK